MSRAKSRRAAYLEGFMQPAPAPRGVASAPIHERSTEPPLFRRQRAARVICEDNSVVALIHGQLQRGPAVMALCIDRRPRRKEGLESSSMAVLRSPVQRGPAALIVCCPDCRPRRKEGLESDSLALLRSQVQRGVARIGCCPDRSPRRKEDRASGSMALPRSPVQRGRAVHVCCPNRSPRRKQDLDSGSMALLRSPVQRGPAHIISAFHVRAPAQGARCRAQQASQAGHVARARGGHEAGAPLRPVVHEQDRGVKVVVAPQRVVAHAVQHRICLHGIALIREQEHGGREHSFQFLAGGLHTCVEILLLLAKVNRAIND
jgi:hypothetical protein